MIFLILLIAFTLIIILSIKPKINNLDFTKDDTQSLKGYCCIFILLHHISYCINNLNYILKPIKYLAFFIVGLFFFISGYGQTYSFDNKKYDKRKYVHSIFKIFFTFLIAIIVTAFINSYVNHDSLIHSIKNLILIKTIPQFWFVYVYLTLTTIFYFLFVKLKVRHSLIYMFCLCIVCIIIMSLIGIGSQWFSSIISFPFGIYVYKNKDHIKKHLYSLKNLIFLFITFILLFCLRIFLSYYIYSGEILHGMFRNLICINFCLFIYGFSLKNSITTNLSKFLGKISYEIYLVHPILLYFINNLSSNSVFILVVIILSIFFSYILNYFVLFVERLVLEND